MRTRVFYARWTIDQITESTATVLVSSSREGEALAMTYRRTYSDQGSTDVVVDWHAGAPDADAIAEGDAVTLYEGGALERVMAPAEIPDWSAIVVVERRALDEVWPEEQLVVDRDLLNHAIARWVSDAFRIAGEGDASDADAVEEKAGEVDGTMAVERADPVRRDVREGNVYWVEHPDRRLYELLLRGGTATLIEPDIVTLLLLPEFAVRTWDVTAVTRRISKSLFEQAVARAEPDRGSAAAR